MRTDLPASKQRFEVFRAVTGVDSDVVAGHDTARRERVTHAARRFVERPTGVPYVARDEALGRRRRVDERLPQVCELIRGAHWVRHLTRRLTHARVRGTPRARGRRAQGGPQSRTRTGYVPFP